MNKKRKIPQGKTKGLDGAVIYRRGAAIYMERAGKPILAKDHEKYFPKDMER